MNSRVVFVLVVVLLAVAFVQHSEAFTAGGGGNVPAGKREFMLKRAVRDLCLAARQHCKREFFTTNEE